MKHVTIKTEAAFRKFGEECELREAALKGVTVEGVVFARDSISKRTCAQCLFLDCTFDNVTAECPMFINCQFTGCVFTNATFKNARFENSWFIHCNCSHASFDKGTSFADTRFSKCCLKGVQVCLRAGPGVQLRECCCTDTMKVSPVQRETQDAEFRLYDDLNDFVVEDCIDTGGQAYLYVAVPLRRDPNLEGFSQCVIRTPRTNGGSQLARIRHEARILGSLASPHIAKLLEVRTAKSGRWYTIMEYIEGPTLDAVIESKCCIDDELKRELTRQCVVALRDLQVANLCHKDIKPANIVLQDFPNKRRLCAKLVDFGFAKCGEGAGAITKTIIFSFPGYHPPELYDESQFDYRGDQFMMGICLFRMWEGGRHPFFPNGIHEPAAVESQVKQYRTALDKNGTVVSKIEEPFRSVIHQMISLDREKRYEDIAEALNTLNGTS
jgi:hypothetical protein